MAKISVRVDDALADEVRRVVGARGVSSVVARAMRSELQRERERRALAELLDELGTELGDADEEVIEQVEALWADT